MTQFENNTTINASPSTVWETLSDIEGIANWAAIITTSPVEGAPGVGAVRTCTLHDGMQVAESMENWEHEKTIGYMVSGLPVPLKATWKLEADGAGTKVTYHGHLHTDDADTGAAIGEKVSGLSQFLLAALKHNVETGDVLAPPA